MKGISKSTAERRFRLTGFGGEKEIIQEIIHHSPFAHSLVIKMNIITILNIQSLNLEFVDDETHSIVQLARNRCLSNERLFLQ